MRAPGGWGRWRHGIPAGGHEAGRTPLLPAPRDSMIRYILNQRHPALVIRKRVRICSSPVPLKFRVDLT